MLDKFKRQRSQKSEKRLEKERELSQRRGNRGIHHSDRTVNVREVVAETEGDKQVRHGDTDPGNRRIEQHLPSSEHVDYTEQDNESLASDRICEESEESDNVSEEEEDWNPLDDEVEDWNPLDDDVEDAVTDEDDESSYSSFTDDDDDDDDIANTAANDGNKDSNDAGQIDDWRSKALWSIQCLLRNKEYEPFFYHEPDVYDTPEYQEISRNPIWLWKIHEGIENSRLDRRPIRATTYRTYTNLQDMETDFHLMIENCKRYWSEDPHGSRYLTLSDKIKADFDENLRNNHFPFSLAIAHNHEFHKLCKELLGLMREKTNYSCVHPNEGESWWTTHYDFLHHTTSLTDAETRMKSLSLRNEPSSDEDSMESCNSSESSETHGEDMQDDYRPYVIQHTDSVRHEFNERLAIDHILKRVLKDLDETVVDQTDEGEDSFQGYSNIDIRGDSVVMDQLLRSLEHPIHPFGDETTLQNLLNFSINNEDEGLERTISEPGSWVLLSPEQTNKTSAIATIVGMASLKGLPSIVIVKDLYSSTRDLAENKLEKYLKAFEAVSKHIRVEFLAGAQSRWHSISLTEFERGNMVLVLPGYASALKHLEGFLNSNNIRNAVLILDEADDMWGTKPFPGSLREQSMYRILGANTDKGKGITHKELQTSRIRSYIQISATHIATVLWHYCFSIPFKKLIASNEELQRGGYVLHEDLELFHSGGLQDADTTVPNYYGLLSNGGMQFVQEFNDMQEVLQPPGFESKHCEEHWESIIRKTATRGNQGRHHCDLFRNTNDTPNPRKISRMMLLCLTPKIHAKTGKNSFHVGIKMLELVPDAVIIVRTGKGSYCFDRGNIPRDLEPEQLNKILLKHESSRRVMHLNQSIEYVDREYGLRRPLIVIGYGCIKRCISVRSEYRVITHCMFRVGGTAPSCTVQQMFMRAAGMTKQLRINNGFGEKIPVLCTEKDYNVMRCLYQFTRDVLNVSGTGLVEDLDRFLETENYDQDLFDAIRQRPLARGFLNNPIQAWMQEGRTRGLSGEFLDLVTGLSVTEIQKFHNQHGASLDGTRCQEISYRLNDGIAKIPIVNTPLIIQLSPEDWELIRDCLYQRKELIKKGNTPNELISQVEESLRPIPWRHLDRRKNIHVLKNLESFEQRLKQRIRTRGGNSQEFRLSSINLMAVNEAERKLLAIIWDRKTCLEQLKLNANQVRSYNQRARIDVSEKSNQYEFQDCTVTPVAWWRPDWNNLEDVSDKNIKFTLSVDLPDGITWENEGGVVEFRAQNDNNS